MSTTEDRIKKIIGFLTGGERGEFVSVRVAREALAGPADFDETMIRLFTAQVINLIPRSCQANLTEADRNAAVRCGGEDKHLVALAG